MEYIILLLLLGPTIAKFSVCKSIRTIDMMTFIFTNFGLVFLWSAACVATAKLIGNGASMAVGWIGLIAIQAKMLFVAIRKPS